MKAASWLAIDWEHRRRPWCKSRRSCRNRKYLQSNTNSTAHRNTVFTNSPTLNLRQIRSF